MALALPVVGITHRVQEIGRIRMGEKSPKGFPMKLKTFRLTANDKRVLEAAAGLYGGKVTAWDGAPDEGQWQVTTEASELDIMVPRRMSVSQAWELWQGGTCVRRCDGTTEALTEQPCLCGPERGSGDTFCDILTRLSVVLPRVPGLGLWRLDTGGWHAASTLPATVDMLLSIDPRPLVPAVLRAVQASSKVRDAATGKVETHRFVRPMLDSPSHTIGQMLLSSPAGDTPALGSGDEEERPRPMTAAERAASRRAEIEAAQGDDDADDAYGEDEDEVLEGQAREAPGGLTKEQLVAALKSAGIPTDDAIARGKELFPPEVRGNGVDLDDEQRAALLAHLTTPANAGASL